MSFIQSEFDHTPFAGLTKAPEPDHWQSRTAAADFRRPTIGPSLRQLGEAAITSGIPALVIPFLFTLASGTSLGWPLIPISLAVLPLALWWLYPGEPVARLGQAGAPAGFTGAAPLTAGQSPGRTGKLTLLGNASLAALLLIAAADHAAAAIASLAIGQATDPAITEKDSLAGLLLPFAIIALTSAAWLLARRGKTPPLRVMLVIEGITLALTLIVLANYAALGGGATESSPIGAAAGDTIAAAAENLGLAALSPILGAGIAFCCFTGALVSLKRVGVKRAGLILARFRYAAGSLG